MVARSTVASRDIDMIISVLLTVRPSYIPSRFLFDISYVWCIAVKTILAISEVSMTYTVPIHVDTITVVLFTALSKLLAQNEEIGSTRMHLNLLHVVQIDNVSFSPARTCNLVHQSATFKY